MEFVLGGVCIGLTALLLYQQHFYLRTIRELVERLSTRDLREYQAVKNPPPPRPRPQVMVEPDNSFDRIIG